MPHINAHAADRRGMISEPMRWAATVAAAFVAGAVVMVLFRPSPLQPAHEEVVNKPAQDANREAPMPRSAQDDFDPEVLALLQDGGGEALFPHDDGKAPGRGRGDGVPLDGGRWRDRMDGSVDRIGAPPGEPRGDGRTGGMGRGISPELMDRCLEVAKEFDSNLWRQLQTVREQRPQDFERVLRRVGRRLIALAELKARDPELYGMKLQELRFEAQVNRTAAELRAARAAGDTARLPGLENGLRTQLRMQLAYSLAARGQFLCKLQEHVALVEAEINHEAAHFEQSVEDRFEQLMDVKTGPITPREPIASPEATAPPT